MKKLASLLLSGALALGLLAGCGGTPGTADTPAANTDTPAAPTQTGSLEGTTLKVGASPAPHAEILAVVKELLAEEGINLEIVEFTDYIQPNTAVENGSIDANYFQHITYLNNFNAENGTHLVSVADVHYEPFGIYAGKTASLEELQDGAQIGVPNDPTNGGRALLLLQEQGLITLKEDVGLEPTKLDIAENPHNYEIVEMEAAQLPRSLGSLDIAVINGNYAIQADLKVADALAIESAEGTAGTAYVNVLAVKEAISLVFLDTFANNWSRCTLSKNDPSYRAFIQDYLGTQLKKHGNHRLENCHGIEELQEINRTSEDQREDRREERNRLFRLIRSSMDIQALAHYRDFVVPGTILLDTQRYQGEYPSSRPVQYLCSLQENALRRDAVTAKVSEEETDGI